MKSRTREKKQTFSLKTLIGTTFPSRSLTVIEWKSVHSITLPPKQNTKIIPKFHSAIFGNNLNDLCERRLVTSKSLSWQCLSDQLFVNVKVIANHSSCYCSWPIKGKYWENCASFQSGRSARSEKKRESHEIAIYEAILIHVFERRCHISALKLKWIISWDSMPLWVEDQHPDGRKNQLSVGVLVPLHPRRFATPSG